MAMVSAPWTSWSPSARPGWRGASRAPARARSPSAADRHPPEAGGEPGRPDEPPTGGARLPRSWPVERGHRQRALHQPEDGRTSRVGHPHEAGRPLQERSGGKGTRTPQSLVEPALTWWGGRDLNSRPLRPEVELSNEGSLDLAPAWSRDGQELAFIRAEVQPDGSRATSGWLVWTARMHGRSPWCPMPTASSGTPTAKCYWSVPLHGRTAPSWWSTSTPAAQRGSLSTPRSRPGLPMGRRDLLRHQGRRAAAIVAEARTGPTGQGPPRAGQRHRADQRPSPSLLRVGRQPLCTARARTICRPWVTACSPDVLSDPARGRHAKLTPPAPPRRRRTLHRPVARAPAIPGHEAIPADDVPPRTP